MILGLSYSVPKEPWALCRVQGRRTGQAANEVPYVKSDETGRLNSPGRPGCTRGGGTGPSPGFKQNTIQSTSGSNIHLESEDVPGAAELVPVQVSYKHTQICDSYSSLIDKTFTWKARMYQERQNWSQSRLRRKQRGCGTHLQSEK